MAAGERLNRKQILPGLNRNNESECFPRENEAHTGIEDSQMQRFKNILVGVDLSQADRFVSRELPPPSVEAVERALWLAKRNSARLTFFYALDVSAAAQRMIEDSDGGKESVLKESQEVLSGLVAQADADGVTANAQVRFGKSWIELIRQVLQNEHDLVVAGTRHQGAWQGFLMGSTGIKLLRKCPCPVWITQPQAERRIKSILVAHDLRPVGDLAMELGCSMARLQNAQLHVIHAAEYPEFDYMFPARISAERKQAYRDEAEKHIASQLTGAALPLPASVHFVIEPPDFAIMNCVEQHDIDLIVMGMVGRAGISGFITGNTAERLLPQIPCSLLAVKPAEFKSPVALERST